MLQGQFDVEHVSFDFPDVFNQGPYCLLQSFDPFWGFLDYRRRLTPRLLGIPRIFFDLPIERGQVLANQ